jgi:hypothetical protein
MSNTEAQASENLPEIQDQRSLLHQIRSLPEFKPLKSKQKRFLLAYSQCGGIRESAAAAKMHWISHYNWLTRDERYKQAFDRAREMYVDLMEYEAFRRATVGDQEPVYEKGELIGYRTKKSDVLLMFSIKGNRPQYRDNFQVNQFAGPVQLNIVGPAPETKQDGE